MIDTEIIAVSAVKESIAKTEVLKPFINDGDKEPSWDGHIYIHENSSKTKKGLKRVPVQVKGVTGKRIDCKKKFRIDRVDLENYLREGGTFLFVVCVSEDGEDKCIYYSSLLPIKIRRLLKGKQGKEVSIDITPFPSSNAEKKTLFQDFYSHMKRQDGIENIELKSIEDLVNSGHLESVTATVVRSVDDERAPEDLLLSLETYAYANIKGSCIPQPLEESINLSKVLEINAAVTVGNEKYYDSIRHVKDRDGFHVEIGSSIKITVEEKSKKLRMDFKPTTFLPSAIKDISFFLDVADNEGFEIGGERLEFKPFKLKDKEREYLINLNDHHKDVIKVLDSLRLSHEVNILDFSLEDQRNTDRFIRALIYNEEVSGLKENIPFLTKLDYLGKTIAIIFQSTDDRHTYKLFDFFATTLPVSFKDEKGMWHETSQFDVLSDKDYLELENIDIKAVVNSYKGLEIDEYIADRINNTVLLLLRAYDNSGDKREDLLNGAKQLSDYLLSSCPDEYLEYGVRLINYSQCLKRIGNIDEKTQCALYDISDDGNQDLRVQISAKMLLEDFYSAKKLMCDLPNDELENIRNYPIYRYWNEV